MGIHLGEERVPDCNDASLTLKLERYRERLQDTSKRNPLINFTDRKASTLRFLDPGIGVLWQAMSNSKSVTFPRPSQKASALQGEELDDQSAQAQQAAEMRERDRRAKERLRRDNWAVPKQTLPIKPDAVTTDKTKLQTNRVLRSLSKRARTSIEEQGVNILYLGFGLLRYEEADAARKILEAPLVMVPVRIESSGAASPYVMSATEDDVVVNPTIKYVLHESYGVTLPEFEETGSLSEYLDLVKDTVRRYKTWSVQDEVVLGTFQFQKLSMFYDLEARRESVLANPVVRAVLGDEHALDGMVIPEVTKEDHDAVPLADNLEIVDADSSQEDAIVLAKHGVSFVLQGPPGTGKSQTITNIIADFIGRGKTVLFVSEKRAALDVVYDKLRQAGLDDFCLVLHGTKASKRSVLDELVRTLDLSRKTINLGSDAQAVTSAAERDRRQLDEYARALSAQIQPLGISLFEANARLAQLERQKAPNIRFSIDDIAEVSQGDLDARCSCLEEYACTRGALLVDPEDCPWKGLLLDAITFQAREELEMRPRALAQEADKLLVDVDRAAKEYGISYGRWLNRIRDTAKSLAGIAGGVGFPAQWNSLDKVSDVRGVVAEQEKQHGLWLEACDAFAEALHGAQALLPESEFAKVDPALRPGTSEELNIASGATQAVMDDNAIFSVWESVDDSAWGAAVARMQAIGARHDAACDTVRERYVREAFDFDFKPIEARFKTEYGSFFKRLGRQHKEDIRALAQLCRSLDGKLRDDDARAVLRDLRELEDVRCEVADFDADGSRLFGEMYDGAATNIADLQAKRGQFLALMKLRSSIDALGKLIAEHEESQDALRSEFSWLYAGWDTDWQAKVLPALDSAEKILPQLGEVPFKSPSGRAKLCTTADARKVCAKLAASIASAVDKVEAEAKWFASLFEPRTLDANNVYELRDRAAACSSDVEHAESWVAFKDACKACEACGLPDDTLELFSEELDPRSTGPEQFSLAYKKRFYALWRDKYAYQHTSMSKFHASTQERIVAEYGRLDVEHFEVAKAQIRKNLMDRLPSMSVDSRSVTRGEVGTLIHEANKKRRIMPLRKLFAEIPELIQRLKPCMMMSPLAVSTFLQDARFDYDLVVFDEASQVRTEDALGAISRGRQTIIAGDAKQLPPTNFFNAVSLGSDEYDEENDAGAFESVLEEAALLPTLTLKWHYRSRSEDLIAFSNQHLYDGKLITFPSSYMVTADRGVEFVYVPEGIYEQGSSKANPIEAQKVADLVFQHFRKYGKDRSLGVIAFGDRQAAAIEDALTQKRLREPEYETYFTEEGEAPFFVKNLENVQGDERDTIILSVGYGKGKSGKLSLNFGPLTLAGGERRLNVAVTRAKINLKLVSSIDASEIDVSNVTNLGPKLLRDYLQYAKTRASGLGAARGEDAEFSSDFERVLHDILTQRGYSVDTKIGNSDYRVDLAVRDPSHPSRYLMGIESDGYEYCSARTARERDRLRAQVLTNMGWEMHRVWSTEWVKDPLRSESQLLEAVARAAAESRKAGQEAPKGVAAGSSQGVKEPGASAVLQTASDTPGTKAAASTPSIASRPEASRSKSEVYAREEPRAASSDPYGFQPYVEYRYNRKNRDSSPVVYIAHVVEVEGPISEEVLVRRVMDACYPNARNLTESLKTEIVSAALLAQSKRQVVRTETRPGVRFYLKPGQTEIEARRGNGRGPDDIYDAEYRSGMIKVIRELVGASKDEVLHEVMNAFGFRRMTPLVSANLERVYSQCLRQGRIVESDGKVFVAAR